MYSLHLTLLLSIPHLPFLMAEYHLRAKAPAPTTAPLFRRQEEFVCPAEQTSCNDGSPGCCSYGESCTFNEDHVPVCLGPCNGISTCSGIFDGLCCNLGYTCNYQATICESDTTSFSTMPLTKVPSHDTSPNAAAPSIPPSPNAAPPSILPTSQAAPPSILPTSQAAPPPPATPGTSPANQPPTLATMPPATQSSATDSSTLISSETMPTAVQPATVTATVNSNSGANSSVFDASNVIVFWFILLNLGLGMMTMM